MKVTGKKIKEEVLGYIRARLRFCATDCCDSMHDMDKYRERFNTLTDDKLVIEDVVRKHFRAEYVAILKEVMEDIGETKETLSFSVMEPPIPLEEIISEL